MPPAGLFARFFDRQGRAQTCQAGFEKLSIAAVGQLQANAIEGSGMVLDDASFDQREEPDDRSPWTQIPK